MEYDKELIAAKLRRWEKYLESYTLPTWKDIPDIGLYMEQVIILLKGYLDYLPPEIKEEQIITAATVNNYVRTKIMPEPVKKKYYRVHIAYLIIICTLKQILPIAMLKTIIPMNISADEVRDIYEHYSARHSITVNYFLEQTRQIAGPILDHKTNLVPQSVDNTADLITSSAIYASLSKLMVERLLLLEGKDITNGGSIDIIKKED